MSKLLTTNNQVTDPEHQARGDLLRMIWRTPETDSHYPAIQEIIEKVSRDSQLARLRRFSEEENSPSVNSELFSAINRQLNLSNSLKLMTELNKDFNTCSDFYPQSVRGVNRKNYQKINWDTPRDLLTFDFLAWIMENFPDPRLILVCMAESLATLCARLKVDEGNKKFDIYDTWDLNSDQSNIPRNLQRRMEFIADNPLRGRTKLQILARKNSNGFGFGGWGIKIVDGNSAIYDGETNPQKGRSNIQLASKFNGRGLERLTPEEYVILMKLLREEGKEFDSPFYYGNNDWTLLKGYIPQCSVVPDGDWNSYQNRCEFHTRCRACNYTDSINSCSRQGFNLQLPPTPTSKHT